MKKYTILIADDYPENVQIIVDALKNSNIQHTVIRAVNGKILCELAEKRIPDLIITDWEMPEMDGIEAIKYLKSIEATKDIPIIMCTGVMTTSENLKMALDSGAVDYIRKPIDNIELQARVYSMLKLSDSYLTIKEQNVVLEQQKKEIETQRNELEITNATKDKFFSIIAHDLRSPFNSFVGYTEIMSEEAPNLTGEEMKKIAVSMRNSAANLFNLLENLLHWARMQQGIFSFELKMIELFPIVVESIMSVMETAKNKGIEITYDIPHDLMVYADSNVLQTVFRNFLSNAVKFSNKGGKVSLSVKTIDKKCAEVSIKDTGIGMSSVLVDNLFRLDVQTNRQGTKGEPSSGLGLIICKDFIEKQGGKLWVESKEGVGSIFYFSLPLSSGNVLSTQ